MLLSLMRLAVQLAIGLLAAASSWALDGVMELDDGWPFLSPAEVALSCGDDAPITGRADLQGRFSLEVEAPAENCVLTVSLQGYSSMPIRVADLPLDPGIPAVTLSRRGRYQGASISPTFLGASSEALAVYHSAMTAHDGEQAADRLMAALELDAGLADAWYQLGRISLASNQIEAARRYFYQAVDADPWFIPAYSPLLLISVGEERWADVTPLCERLLAMNPYLADAHYYSGLARLQTGDLAGAEESLRSIEEGPEADRFAETRHLRGLVREKQGQPKTAAAEYEAYLARDPDGPAAELVRQRLRALGKAGTP